MVQGFLAVWFGGLTLMGGLLLLLPRSAWGGGRPPPWYAILGPLGMMLLGAGFIRACRLFARGQTENIRSFLARELQAQLHVEGKRE
jgi:hypothetical protein